MTFAAAFVILGAVYLALWVLWKLCRMIARNARELAYWNHRTEAAAKSICEHEHIAYGVMVYPDGVVMDVCEDCGKGWAEDDTEHEGIVMG